MKSTIARAALLVLTLAGCGNWSDEDAEFLAALPRREDLTLSVPEGQQQQALDGYGTTGQALLGASNVYPEVVAQVKGVNGFVSALTAGLDFVRTLWPSKREPDARTWGPWNDDKHPGMRAQVVIRRAEPGRYTYQLQFKRQTEPGEFVDVITGEFLGEAAAQGHGSFKVDGAQMIALGINEPGDRYRTLSLAYDMRQGGAVARVDVEPLDLLASDLVVGYAVKPDGGGRIDYSLPNRDLVPGPGEETLSIHAVWLASKAGAVAFSAVGGDLGALRGEYQECWSEGFQQVYWHKNFECGADPSCSDGRLSDCAVAPPTP